jgi:hypothetical protein
MKDDIEDLYKPEALRLADCLETEKVGAILGDSAAAELRRLHEENTELLKILKEKIEKETIAYWQRQHG